MRKLKSGDVVVTSKNLSYTVLKETKTMIITSLDGKIVKFKKSNNVGYYFRTDSSEMIVTYLINN